MPGGLHGNNKKKIIGFKKIKIIITIIIIFKNICSPL